MFVNWQLDEGTEELVELNVILYEYTLSAFNVSLKWNKNFFYNNNKNIN